MDKGGTGHMYVELAVLRDAHRAGMAAGPRCASVDLCPCLRRVYSQFPSGQACLSAQSGLLGSD